MLNNKCNHEAAMHMQRKGPEYKDFIDDTGRIGTLKLIKPEADASCNINK